MATREEKLQIIEDLKTQIQVVKTEVENQKTEKRVYTVGGFIRTGIVLFLIAVGIGIAAYLL